MKLKELLNSVYTKFKNARLHYGHGTDNPWDEAVQLVLHVLKLPMDSNDQILNNIVSNEQAEKIYSLTKERIETRKPLPYLLNQAWFMGLPFYVDERVLIPRSPFFEWIQKDFSPFIKKEKVKRILDIGTGSACIAIACAIQFPDAVVDASDIDKNALEVAKINIEKYDLSNRINLILSDGFQHIEKRYDVIITNPPYVDPIEKIDLPQEYFHEPHEVALFAGDNGMAIVDHIMDNAGHHLTEDGILLIEVGNNRERFIKAYENQSIIELENEFGGHGLFILQGTHRIILRGTE